MAGHGTAMTERERARHGHGGGRLVEKNCGQTDSDWYCGCEVEQCKQTRQLSHTHMQMEVGREKKTLRTREQALKTQARNIIIVPLASCVPCSVPPLKCER